MSTKEEFTQSFVDAVTEKSPDMAREDIEKLADQLWVGREINYAVVDNESFNVLAHRYFHGVGHVRMQILLSSIPEQLMFIMPLILSEYMFAYGFMCGKADEQGWDVDTVAPEAPALECLSGRANILRSREELDQEDALPATIGNMDDILPEGFKPPGGEDPGEESGYFPNN